MRMLRIRNLVKIVFFVAVLAISFQANAQEWIFCDNCVTSQDFRNAAVQKVGQSVGEFEYAVGNTVTGKFEYVFITNFPGDLQPFGTAPTPDNAGDNSEEELGSTVLIVPSEENSILIDPFASVDPSNQSTGLTVGSFPASALENQAFEGAVWAHRNQIIVSPPSNTVGFESFRGRDFALVSGHLFSMLTATKPHWAASQIFGNLRNTLFKALKLYFKGGVTACQVFANGDSACFEVFFFDVWGAKYIEGSAKDANGNPIETEENNGAFITGGGLDTVRTETAPNEFIVRFSGSTYVWLFCAFSGGELISCWIETHPT